MSGLEAGQITNEDQSHTPPPAGEKVAREKGIYRRSGRDRTAENDRRRAARAALREKQRSQSSPDNRRAARAALRENLPKILEEGVKTTKDVAEEYGLTPDDVQDILNKLRRQGKVPKNLLLAPPPIKEVELRDISPEVAVRAAQDFENMVLRIRYGDLSKSDEDIVREVLTRVGGENAKTTTNAVLSILKREAKRNS